MRESEEFAEQFLKHIFAGQIAHEPFGYATPPDFLISGSIAAEVTSIRKIAHHKEAMNYCRNFYKKFFPHKRELIDRHSFYVNLSYQKIFPNRKEMQQIADHIAQNFYQISNQTVLRFANNVTVRFQSTERDVEYRFIHMWPNDEYGGGYVYDDLKREVENAIRIKSFKLSKLTAVQQINIREYLLVLIDSINYAQNQEYVPDLRREIDKQCFSKIYLVNPMIYKIYQQF